VVVAQTALPLAKIDEYVQAEMQKQRIPGMSVALVRNGQIVHAKGYGLANLEHQVAVKPETIFQSGSVGKQFTATAVMLLVEDGKLALDDLITKHFKDAPAAWQKITIRHLLTHTSGMTDYPRDFDFRRDHTEADLLKQAMAIPLAFQPGERWSYSNVGYITLGILISQVTGKFYGEFLQERIFKPLGMTTARIINEADIIPNRAQGYRLVNGELKHQEWVSPVMNTTADGSLYLTLYDMAKWDAALYGDKLLTPASLAQMWTKAKLNDGKEADYGFGWQLAEVRGHRLIEHGGAWQGFKSHIARYVNEKLTIIAFANLAQGDPTRITHGIAKLIDPTYAPEPPQAIEDKEPHVTALIKTVLLQVADASIKPETFTPEFAAQIFPQRVKQFSETFKSFGALQKMELLARRDRGEERGYRYRLIYANGNHFCTVALTKDNKIAGLSLQLEE
jgi:CubicO group peptidase (beta-lactamase class C family)